MNTETDQDAPRPETPGADAAETETPEARAARDGAGQPVTDIEGDPAADLRAQLAEAQVQAGDYLGRLKRVQADFENYKKRKEKEQSELFTLNEDRLLGEFLPLFDDLRRAFDVYEKDRNKDVFIEGVERIFAKFREFLDAKGVVAISAVGQKFDPALHEVLLSVEAEGEPHRVLEEFECGYTRKGRLLRPSRVTVSKPPDKSAAQAATDAANDNDDQHQDSQAKE